MSDRIPLATEADRDRADDCYNALSSIFSQVNVRWESREYLAPIFAAHRIAAMDATVAGERERAALIAEEQAAANVKTRQDRLALEARPSPAMDREAIIAAALPHVLWGFRERRSGMEVTEKIADAILALSNA